MTAAISSQPLLRSRLARAPTATSRLRVAKRHRDEGADRHDEHDDADLAEHPTDGLGVDDLGVGVQQPVDPVDRRQDQLLDRLAEAQRRRHLLEGARDRRTVGVELVLTGRQEQRDDPHEDRDDGQRRDRRGELESSLLLALRSASPPWARRQRWMDRRSSTSVVPRSVRGVADDRARHAVPAAAAASELGTDDGDDLDALLAQQRVGVGVAVVGEHDARRGAHEVGPAVPLGALADVVVPAGLDDPQARAGPARRATTSTNGLSSLRSSRPLGRVGRAVGEGVDLVARCPGTAARSRDRRR